MTALATLTATLSLWHVPTQAAAIVGPATHYRAGLMEQVAVNRGLILDVADYDDWLTTNGYAGMVALERSGDLFRDVWIDGERYLVADCRARHHYPGRHVVEVDYQTARRWLDAGEWPERVEVRFWPGELMEGRYRPE